MMLRFSSRQEDRYWFVKRYVQHFLAILSLQESTFETRKYAFYVISKAFFVLEIP